MDISDEVLKIAKAHLKRVSKSGPDNVMAICPFHRKADGSMETGPSFALSLSKGVFFCHSCGAKGSFVQFLKDLGHTSEHITANYGVLVDALRNNIPPPRDPTKTNIVSLDPLPDNLLGLFDYCPTALLEEGFDEATLSYFDVGFDRWNMRVTFPMRDIEGQLVGISGRTVLGVDPRYKVYDREYVLWGLPERVGWDKATVLYNSHRVYPELYHCTNESYVILCEGFKAVMGMYAAGFPHVVGLLGTYLSYEQQLILERLGATVYLFLDHDWPGMMGTYNAGLRLLRSLPLKVVEYPSWVRFDEELSPDELSPKERVECVYRAVDYVSWLAKMNTEGVQLCRTGKTPINSIA